jgi:peptidoglycan LD-endopeptidase CwlK
MKKAIDKITLARIQLLHPLIREEVLQTVNRIVYLLPHNCTFRITQSLRTFSEQNIMYKQGRSNKYGKIITNAKGGESYHNYGLAFDFCLIDNGITVNWSTSIDRDNNGTPEWLLVVREFKAIGYSWGGDWLKFKDYPHLQKSFGYTTKELLSLYNIQKSKKGFTYVVLP